MTFVATNPADGSQLGTYETHTSDQIEEAVQRAENAFLRWRARPVPERAALLAALASTLRSRQNALARLASQEMGRPIKESRAETEKSASFCEYYAKHAESMLASRTIEGGAQENYVRFEPIGAVLAVMPWNFPYVQVFRFAPAALVAGNVALLKHASNVPGCAIAIEELFAQAGFPAGGLPDSAGQTRGSGSDSLRRSRRGSGAHRKRPSRQPSRCHRRPRAQALGHGAGGSDPFVVLEDADLDAAAVEGCRGRNINAGQACIAAKRFIVMDAAADEFVHKLAAAVAELKMGDPLDPTADVGPMARRDLVDGLERQVQESFAAGAEPARRGV